MCKEDKLEHLKKTFTQLDKNDQIYIENLTNTLTESPLINSQKERPNIAKKGQKSLKNDPPNNSQTV